jgi:hypothetical protein
MALSVEGGGGDSDADREADIGAPPQAETKEATAARGARPNTFLLRISHCSARTRLAARVYPRRPVAPSKPTDCDGRPVHQFKRFAVVRNDSKTVKIGVRPFDPGEGSRSRGPITVGPREVDCPGEPGSCKLTAEREALKSVSSAGVKTRAVRVVVGVIVAIPAPVSTFALVSRVTAGHSARPCR